MFTLSKNPHVFSHAKTADQSKQNARHKGQARVSQSERSTRLFIIMNEKRYTGKFLSPTRPESYLDYLK